jgi:hypothetical protein
VAILAGLLLAMTMPAAALAGEAQPLKARSFWQRLRPFKNTTIIITAGLSVGPFFVGASSQIGLVLRARSSPEPQGVFWQNAADVTVGGLKRISSPVPELRGWEWNLGPSSRRHPIYGDRVGFSIIPDLLSIAAARSGGLGLGTALPIPGLPFTMFRMPVTIYVANPKLCKISGKVIDCVDRLTAIAMRLTAPVWRPAKRVLTRVGAPMLRTARPAVERVRGWAQRHRRRPGEPPAQPSSPEPAPVPLLASSAPGADAPARQRPQASEL